MATNPVGQMDDDDEDDAPEAPEADASPAQMSGPSSPMTGVPAPAGPAMNPQLAAYLKTKSDALQAAQKSASTNRLMSGIGRAADTLAHSAYGSTTGADKSTWDEFDREANAPVENLLTAQKSEAQEVANKESEDSADPDSDKSKAVQATVAKLYPGKFTPEQLKKVSAADAQDVLFKPLELDERIKSAQETKRAAVQSRQDTLNESAAARRDKAQDSAMMATGQMLEAARGNPAVQQAEKDIYASAKVKSLANLYGNPDNLNPEMVKLLTSEIGKIAAGGQATESELNFLTPSSLRGKLAGVWQKLTNEPSPAHAGAFLKQYQDYADSLTKDAQSVIEDKYGRIINSRAGILGKDNVEQLHANYTNRFKNLTERSPQSTGGAPPQRSAPKAGAIVQVKGKQYRVGSDGDSLEPL